MGYKGTNFQSSLQYSKIRILIYGKVCSDTLGRFSVAV